MSNRIESRISHIFYHIIDNVESDLWMKYIRLLGIPESEIKSVISQRRDTFQEKQYQCLSRWKMCLGRIGEQEIERTLQDTLAELDRGTPFATPLFYSRTMVECIQFAKAIYEFIEPLGEIMWRKVVRTNLDVPDKEVNRLTQANMDDILETKYQIILRYQRIQGLSNQQLIEYLKHLSVNLMRERPLQQ